MTHEEMREQTGAYVLGAIDLDERERFEAHLTGCPECQAEVRSLDRVTAALAFIADSREPSPQLRSRIIDRVASGTEARKPSRAVTVGPWLVAMAASVALVILAPYTLRLRERTRELTLTVRDLTARLLDRDRQLVAVRSEVSLLAAPDVKRVDLRGQRVAPRAGGRAFWSRTRGVYFVASDLPGVPNDKAYQLWFVTATGPVSASVFKPDDQGRVEVVASIPPDLAALTALAVTLEPAGGVPAPTGDMYLVGQVNQN